MYQLIFYVPASHIEQVKNAVFAAGAGTYGNYDQCAWQTLGQGQFRPLAGSQPFSGQIGRLETAPEYKVELICSDENIKPAVAALLAAHPYQQPAYAVYKILTAENF
jgi:structural hemagglutinin/hemolysin toxin protein RtxA